jgi:hypothetical protein
MVALCELEMVVAVAAKVAVLAPAATVTDAGTVKALLLPERLTTVPPLAGSDSVTVHVDVDPEASAAGVH